MHKFYISLHTAFVTTLILFAYVQNPYFSFWDAPIEALKAITSTHISDAEFVFLLAPSTDFIAVENALSWQCRRSEWVILYSTAQ